jgi:hypothetical protein
MAARMIALSRARFLALWSQRDAASPNALGIGRRFRDELLAMLRFKQRLHGSWTVLLTDVSDAR